MLYAISFKIFICIKLETYEFFFVTFNFIIKKWYTALMFNFYTFILQYQMRESIAFYG